MRRGRRHELQPWYCGGGGVLSAGFAIGCCVSRWRSLRLWFLVVGLRLLVLRLCIPHDVILSPNPRESL